MSDVGSQGPARDPDDASGWSSVPATATAAPRRGGPERCARPCVECSGRHHFSESGLEFAVTKPEHEAARHHVSWWECKHCDAWTVDPPGAEESPATEIVGALVEELGEVEWVSQSWIDPWGDIKSGTHCLRCGKPEDEHAPDCQLKQALRRAEAFLAVEDEIAERRQRNAESTRPATDVAELERRSADRMEDDLIAKASRGKSP